MLVVFDLCWLCQLCLKGYFGGLDMVGAVRNGFSFRFTGVSCAQSKAQASCGRNGLVAFDSLPRLWYLRVGWREYGTFQPKLRKGFEVLLSVFAL